MKLQTITINYGVKRCQSYQSVDCSASVTFELEEGEDRKTAIDKAHRWLAGQVNAQANAAIAEVIHAASMDLG